MTSVDDTREDFENVEIFYQSAPEGNCCASCASPIESCSREDVVSWQRREGANLWCPCCGRFWQGSDEDVAEAVMYDEAWERLQGTAEGLKEWEAMLQARSNKS